MYTVYVLYSKKYKKTYTGFTSNMDDRFKSPNELATKGFTVKYRPWEIAYTEEYDSKQENLPQKTFHPFC